jgi:hypothetical protein
MIVDIHDTLCKKPNFDKCSKIDEFSKEFILIWWDNYNAFLIHLRCLSPSTWVVPIHFQITIERWHNLLLFSTITQWVSIVSKSYFKPKVNVPISDNQKFKILDKRHHANPAMDQNMLLVL